MSQEWVVTAKDQGKKLAELLALYGRLSSRKKARRILEQGRCAVNGVVHTFASRMMHQGDRITLSSKNLSVCSFSSSILYEDDWILALNKAPGVSVETLEQQSGSLLVHRLDKETSGILLLAKSKVVREQFISLFRKREVVKYYLALVDRVVPPKGVVEEPLSFGKRLGSQIYWKVDSQGKPSRTVFRRLHNSTCASCVLVQPQTGRTHQIRVHFSCRGNPILGDYQYGRQFDCALRPTRHQLHAWKLCCAHPILKQDLVLTASLFDDMLFSIEELFGADRLSSILEGS